MIKKYLIFIFSLVLILVSTKLTFSQLSSTINVQLNKVYDATFQGGGVPNISTFKIQGVLEVVDNFGTAVETIDLSTNSLIDKVDNANEHCIIQFSPNSQEFDWHDNHGYRGSASTNKFYYDQAYYIQVHLKINAFQKKGPADFCNCDNTIHWDPSINCFHIPFIGRVCLGGFVGPADKDCDNNFEVIYVINQNSTPYKDSIFQTISNMNNRYGVELKVNFTAPAPLVPNQAPETTAGSWAKGSQTITNEVKCGGENFHPWLVSRF